MDKAQELVRMVARAFYETEPVVIVDALVRHGALNVADLQYIFVNSAKAKGAVQIFAGQLKVGGLISSFTQMETKANAQKPTAVEYYFIDYRRAIDATKFRLWYLEEALRRKAGPAEDKKEYKCLRCKAEYTELDVMDRPSPDGASFMCAQCGNVLNYFPRDAEDAETTGPVGVFNQQLGWLVQRMQDIDKVTIPIVSPESAFAGRIEVPRPKAPLEGPKQEITSVPAIRPTAVRGLVTGPQKIQVSITSDADNTSAAQLAAAAQRERLAAQNALPDWHTRSTVSNEMTAAGQREEAAKREREAEVGLLTADSTEEKKAIHDESLDDVFAALEEEQRVENERRDREDEEEDDDDEEEEEFEDVDVGTNGVPDAKKVKLEVATPATNASGSGVDAEDSEEEFEDV